MNFPHLKNAALLAAGILLAGPAAHAVGINITYTDSAGEGFNDPTLGASRRTCLEAVLANWGSRLNGAIPIEVHASFDSLGGTANGAILGQAYANYTVSDGTHSFAIALANQLANQKITPAGQADIVIQYNSDVDNDTVLSTAGFNYGTDGRLTISKADAQGFRYYNIDFYDTCLHEMGHGLGFFSSLNQAGAYGNGFPTIYDAYLATGPNADSPLLTSLTAAQRSTALTSGSLYYIGPNALAANGGVGARIYAPATYAPGSTRSHLDEATYSGSLQQASINELMTPSLGPGVMHYPGPIVSGIFEDMGWSFTPYTIADAAVALQTYGGLHNVTQTELTRLNREGLTTYPSHIDMSDAVRIARAAAGVDDNPYILGTP